MTEPDLAHWAEGSNKEPVIEGIRDIDQDPDLFTADEADEADETGGE